MGIAGTPSPSPFYPLLPGQEMSGLFHHEFCHNVLPHYRTKSDESISHSLESLNL